ncbi:type II toxin-antitoxin system RelE/ParE family toxin [Flavobacterium eburneipallidum]|uniref:type II toxin-antitoxin system RelE/ParE family toxin n=1 Tax=Flavobacterium eburneipallidum TaxID=3003263 RepID=UPI0022AC652F|nr:type II toxin-antitoxin system RelE/ParE family toxin [Flavobacterium eburneipallidum]
MLNIIWSEEAIDDVLNNIDYLEREWTEKEVKRFSDKTNEILDKLSNGNIRFKKSKYKDVLEVPIVKQINLFYKKEAENIILLRFWNNYQDPEKLKLK